MGHQGGNCEGQLAKPGVTDRNDKIIRNDKRHMSVTLLFFKRSDCQSIIACLVPDFSLGELESTRKTEPIQCVKLSNH